MPSLADACLMACFFWAVAGPLTSRWIADRLELFILGLGTAAVTVSWSWSGALVAEALLRPMKVCGALLLGSLVFSFSHDSLRAALRRAAARFGLRACAAAALAVIALSAGFLTMPIAILIWTELVTSMRLERRSEVHAAVLGAFAVALGGVLTPVGGSVASIAMAKLSAAAYPVGPRFLFDLVGAWVVPAVLTLALLCGFLIRPAPEPAAPAPEDPLTLWSMLALAARMFVFIAGLVLLGEGLLPLINAHLLGLPPSALFWANSAAAAVDGATLAALEITPSMSQDQLRYALMGIVISSGALVTGDPVNLVASRRMRISMKEWAAVGVPTAAGLMLFYYLSLLAN